MLPLAYDFDNNVLIYNIPEEEDKTLKELF